MGSPLARLPGVLRVAGEMHGGLSDIYTFRAEAGEAGGALRPPSGMATSAPLAQVGVAPGTDSRPRSAYHSSFCRGTGHTCVLSGFHFRTRGGPSWKLH